MVDVVHHEEIGEGEVVGLEGGGGVYVEGQGAEEHRNVVGRGREVEGEGEVVGLEALCC